MTSSSIGHQNKCQHPECLCQAEPGKQYCSDYCQNAHKPGSKPGAGHAGSTCGCGHSACQH
jgi:hypothetical protein